MKELAKEFKRLFDGEKIDRVLTVEASGIAAAVFVALEFDVPLVFAKKAKTKNIDPANVYVADVYSYTHGITNQIVISRDFLKAGERVLLIDDFLANGKAMLGLTDIVRQAGAEVVGIGVLVEKAYQRGEAELKERGYRVEALAKVASMDPETGIVFAEN